MSDTGRQGSSPPDEVGCYRILDELGRGGMGTVYLAEQTEPVHRRVALKVLNRAKHTERGIARFEAERQALALMNHPSIATVFEAGTTVQGLPFFAMEAVVGMPLEAYCDSSRLDVESRLALFRQICDAVQHAHLKMVIHRDLKPSNVLVTLDDNGRPLAKVIDFGIATSADLGLARSPELERHAGMPVGTPMFMSPEQIEGESDIDLRTDIYALGVLLYQVLVGVGPFDNEAVEPYQLMMRILEEQPPAPSARFAALDPAQKEEIAGRRRTSPAQLRRRLAGDLDAIVGRAMAKDRERRYSSASELRADVDRHLRHERALAVRATVPYRLGKFVRRNRPSVAAGIAAIVVLVAALVASSVSGVRARRARDAALAAEARATSTVDYLRKVLASADPGVEGRRVRVVDVLERASEMVASDLVGEPEVEASVRKTIGLTLLELGLFEQSASELERVVALQRERLGEDHPETLDSINSLGRLEYKLGRYQRAADIHRSVYAKQRSLLGADDPVAMWTMYNLAKALDKLGEWSEAERLYRDNGALRTRVLGPDHPDTLVTVNAHSLFLGTAGRPEEAEQLQRENLATLRRVVGPEHPDTLRAQANLVEILNQQGRYDEAGQLALQTIVIEEQVFGQTHPETIGTRAQLAVALCHQGRCPEAEEILREVRSMRQSSLGVAHPDTAEAGFLLGLAVLRQGRSDEADALLDEAMTTARDTLGSAHYRLPLFAAHRGMCLAELGRWRDAESWLLSTVAPLQASDRPEERWVVENLIRVYEHTGRPAMAEELRRRLGT